MADRARRRPANAPVLQVKGLHVYYGQSHALQGVDLTLDAGVHAVVGRNGMGKTTLCNAIMGMLPVRRGSIRFRGEELVGVPSFKIAQKGVGYTPQGRRLWPSLTVHEHLKLFDSGSGSWSVDRVYETFPRLAERRNNGGAQLSGGEQQMLAIGRSLARDVKLLLLDEPYEGLAPVIVQEIEKTLEHIKTLGITTIIVEQNAIAALHLADRAIILDMGQVAFDGTAQEVLDNAELRQEYLAI